VDRIELRFCAHCSLPPGSRQVIILVSELLAPDEGLWILCLSR